MSKLRALAFTAMLIGAASAAHAHAMLDHAVPAVGSTVASAHQVTLYFTEQLEPKFSGATVHSATGARVDRGASVHGNVMRISLKALPPGTYMVAWHALSVDTHRTQGSFSFNVGR
jgi:methionine-rich copper-binding protein CopC